MDTSHPPIPRTSTDWNALWQAKQHQRCATHDAAHWDARAKTFTHKDSPNSYVERFLALAAIRPGESVLDMGCGTGNLSIPLGKEGHDVLAADFSSGMLSRLREALRKEDLHDVEALELAWEDDWCGKGVLPESRDVCIASRSIATEDMHDALLKLTATARRRCCITLATGSSPRTDDRMLYAVGLTVPPSYDAVYAIAILQGEGFMPTLSYIDTTREDRFASFEEAFERYRSMAQGAAQELGSLLSESVLDARVEAWLKDHGEQRSEGPQGSAFVLSDPRHVMWAFIAWDTTARTS